MTRLNASPALLAKTFGAVMILVALFAFTQPAKAILGGQTVEPGYFGYMAFVSAEMPDGSGADCSGSLVTLSVVLTAAHCVVDESTNTILAPEALTVTTGTLDVGDSSGGQVLSVRRVEIPSTWNYETLRGDVALLELAAPSTAETMPVAPASDTWAYQAGESILVAGWGQTSPGSDATPPLQWLDLTVQSNAYCAAQFRAPEFLFDARSMFCASQPGTSAGFCHGDSGAPAVVESADGQYETIGVVSWTRDAQCSPPDSFARVSFVSAWLVSTIGVLQGEAPTAASAPAAQPVLPKAQVREPPSLQTRLTLSAPGRKAKLRFWVGSESGRLHVHVRVMTAGRVIYSTVSSYFQPTPGVYTIAWKVPRTLKHSVRFCMWAALYASGAQSATSCSNLRITPL